MVVIDFLYDGFEPPPFRKPLPLFGTNRDESLPAKERVTSSYSID